jgi:ankyrin repeat protein
VKENKLMDLIGNRFDKLVYLEPETIRAFLVKFSPQKDKTIATYIDSDGYTALHWAAHQGNWEAIKALAEAFPTPNPNITNKHGDTPLILALKNKLDLRASRMFGKSSKSFTRKM